MQPVFNRRSFSACPVSGEPRLHHKRITAEWQKFILNQLIKSMSESQLAENHTTPARKGKERRFRYQYPDELLTRPDMSGVLLDQERLYKQKPST
jgi:hypothetical protein